MKLVARLIAVLALSTPPVRALAADGDWWSKAHQFLSWGVIPTSTGVASNWDSEAPVLDLYDSAEFNGHGDFVARGLKTGVTFRQFKDGTRHHARRKWLPFFLFDLRSHSVTLDEVHYAWAVRLEDYQYDDDPAQMTATTLTLLEAIRKKIGGNGVVVPVSAHEETRRYADAGFGVLTLSQLLAELPTEKVTVLSPGTAFGYLRRGIDGGARFGLTDIVVYDTLPARVPPVAGFVSLAPQTPLSHVNLLAINRGTVNLYLASLDFLPGAAERIGKPVKLVASKSRISISDATDAEVKAFARKRVAKIAVPKPDRSLDAVIDLESAPARALDVKVIGAKAANYALLQKAFPEYVRPGHAIPFAAYFAVVESSGAAALIARLPGEEGANDELLKQIRRKILGASVPPALLRSIRAFAHQRIRLRSSTNCEDLPGFNGAGLYLSKGFEPKEADDELAAKILEVYASLWTPLAEEERRMFGIEPSAIGMAILINDAFEDEFANGVAITIPGRNGVALLVNAQPGDSLITNPGAGDVPESILFSSMESSAWTRQSASSRGPVFLSPGMEPTLLELKAVARKIHRLFAPGPQAGVDIEFKLQKESGKIHLYVKQARLLSAPRPE